MTQPEAQTACQQRYSYFLPRVTNVYIQSKLADFRSASGSLLANTDLWIDVRAFGISYFHWIDGSSLAG